MGQSIFNITHILEQKAKYISGEHGAHILSLFNYVISQKSGVIINTSVTTKNLHNKIHLAQNREKVFHTPNIQDIKISPTCIHCGPGELSRYSDQLRAGRSGDQNPVRARFSTTIQTGPGAHLASYTMSTRSFLGAKCGRGVLLTTHSHLALRLRKEQGYTSTPPLDFRGLFQGELYLYLYLQTPKPEIILIRTKRRVNIHINLKGKYHGNIWRSERKRIMENSTKR